MAPALDERIEERAHVAALAHVIRSIRKARRMRSSEVAKAMGLAPRTYEHFERGTGRITYSRIRQFAQVTDSDPVAIMATVVLRVPDFALNCADNKLMTIAMTAVHNLNEELGPDIGFIATSSLVVAFDRLVKDLIEEVRRRDQFAERWIEEKTSKLDGATFRASRPRSR